MSGRVAERMTFLQQVGTWHATTELTDSVNHIDFAGCSVLVVYSTGVVQSVGFDACTTKVALTD